MTRERLNRVIGYLPIILSLAALCLLLVAFTTGWERGLKDEGVVAHTWQLLIAVQVPLLLTFFATADWRRSWHVAKLFAIQVIALALALAPVAYFNL